MIHSTRIVKEVLVMNVLGKSSIWMHDAWKKKLDIGMNGYQDSLKIERKMTMLINIKYSLQKKDRELIMVTLGKIL